MHTRIVVCRFGYDANDEGITKRGTTPWDLPELITAAYTFTDDMKEKFHLWEDYNQHCFLSCYLYLIFRRFLFYGDEGAGSAAGVIGGLKEYADEALKRAGLKRIGFDPRDITSDDEGIKIGTEEYGKLDAISQWVYMPDHIWKKLVRSCILRCSEYKPKKD